MSRHLVVWVGVLMSADGVSAFAPSSSSFASAVTPNPSGTSAPPAALSTRPLSPQHPSTRMMGLRGGGDLQDLTEWGQDDVCHRHNLARLVADHDPEQVEPRQPLLTLLVRAQPVGTRSAKYIWKCYVHLHMCGRTMLTAAGVRRPSKALL